MTLACQNFNKHHTETYFEFVTVIFSMNCKPHSRSLSSMMYSFFLLCTNMDYSTETKAVSQQIASKTCVTSTFARSGAFQCQVDSSSWMTNSSGGERSVVYIMSHSLMRNSSPENSLIHYVPTTRQKYGIRHGSSWLSTFRSTLIHRRDRGFLLELQSTFSWLSF